MAACACLIGLRGLLLYQLWIELPPSAYFGVSTLNDPTTMLGHHSAALIRNLKDSKVQ